MGTDWSSLTASLVLPVQGSTAGFSDQVKLTNTSDQAIPLTPCPSYSESVNDVIEIPNPNGFPTQVPMRGGGNSFSLNCAAAPSEIPPNSSLTFDIQFSTAQAAATAGAQLTPRSDVHVTWTMPGVAAATGTIDIVA